MGRLALWRLPLFTLALALLFGCAATTPKGATAPRQEATLEQHEPIRVGAWNIEWLGLPERRSGPAAGHLQSPQALAEYILAADVDILGLEEVRIDADDGSDTNAQLTAAFELVEQQDGGRWQHRLFPTTYGRHQCTGIAWDSTKVTPIGEPRVATGPNETSTQGKRLWSRPPRGWLFSAGEGFTDFVVVVIHMKSNYGGDFAQHRAQEARFLVTDLPEAFEDPDVLIIGDANCSAHTEPAVTAITSAGFVDLNGDDIDTHWRYGPLDRIFAPVGQPEFARQVFAVLSDSFFAAHDLSVTDFKVRYSDHFMVITEVDVLPDDD
jgi:endonuclease/exonuclease/phosphatase family metal-dependent hydrolase